MYLGLTPLNGGFLFGLMGLLACASLAGLIVSIVLYTHGKMKIPLFNYTHVKVQNFFSDSVRNAQWKIFGIVVSSILIITIIVTIIILICCYKQGYIRNINNEIYSNAPSTNKNTKESERQKAILRKTNKCDRANGIPLTPSDGIQDLPSLRPTAQASHQADDTQTNTEATIATLRPKNFNRSASTSKNGYGGISHRPIFSPEMTARSAQMLPYGIDEGFQIPQVIYEAVTPMKEAPPRNVQTRVNRVPGKQTSDVEVVETERNQPRATIVQRVPKEKIISQLKPRVEHIKPEQKGESQNIEYVGDKDEEPHRLECIDVEEQQPGRTVQKPQYEAVEEAIKRLSSISSLEEIAEAVHLPKHERKRRIQNERKQAYGKISVKHVKSNM